jgi:hypothetical protein
MPVPVLPLPWACVRLGISVGLAPCAPVEVAEEDVAPAVEPLASVAWADTAQLMDSARAAIGQFLRV